MINAVPVFRLFEKKGMDHLPRVYISDPVALPQQRNSGEIFANMQRIIRSYDSMSGIVLELKRIINSPKWNTAWISLFAEAFGCYKIKTSFVHNIQFRFSLVCKSNFLKLFMYLYFCSCFVVY